MARSNLEHVAGRIKRIADIFPGVVTDEVLDHIGGTLTDERVTYAEFLELDERPGQFYSLGDSHWLIRRYRNSQQFRSHEFATSLESTP